MRAMFVAVLLAGAGVLISTQHADAKLATYIITGGDLGDRAYCFDGFGASEVFWLPGTGTQLDSPPAGDLGVAYDIFPAFGYLDVVRQQQGAGPDMRYYPDRGLLHYPHPPETWYLLQPETREFVDGAIAEALDRKARGELPAGPVAGALEAMSIDELWLKPYADIGPLATYRPEASCAQCAQVSHVGTFVTEHLLETLSRPPVRSVRTLPRYAIESPMGQPSSYSGILGFYSPPTDDEPGRFWTDMYFSDYAQPFYETTTGFDDAAANALGLSYYETTPGFDEAVTDALAAAGGQVAPRSADRVASQDSALAVSTALGAGMLALSAVALVGARVASSRRSTK